MYMPLIKQAHYLKSLTLFAVRRNHVYMYEMTWIQNKELHEMKQYWQYTRRLCSRFLSNQNNIVNHQTIIDMLMIAKMFIMIGMFVLIEI